MTQADISLQESQFVLNMERARLDRSQNGEYTKKGLEALVNAATCQYKMYRMSSGAAAQRHKENAAEILKEAYQQAKKLGIILPNPETPAAKESGVKPAAVTPPANPGTPAPAVKKSSAKPEEDPEKELEQLVGLEDAKKLLKDIINFLITNNIRKERDLPLLVASQHMVFTGNPGTGKTTVARLVSGILKKRGVLSKGHLVELNGNDLVQGYVGHSAEKTRKAGEEAIGGILFIDEAYAINDSKFKDEIIPTLLSIMENNQDDLIVIVAGYTKEMQEFIDSNMGLQSRFTNYVYFPDYSAEDMCTIFERMCKSKGQTVSPDAMELLKSIFEERRTDPAFGNARGVRNMFNSANIALSRRVAAVTNANGTVSNELLTTITIDDVRAAAEKKNKIEE